MMNAKEIENLKVGSILENLLGDKEKVVKKEGCFFILKWLHDDGTLSEGEEWCVKSHLESGYKLVQA